MCIWSRDESVLGGVCSVCVSVGPHSHLQSATQCGGVPDPASEGL